MKRVFVLFTLLIMLFSISACGLDLPELPTNGFPTNGLPTTQPPSYSISQIPNPLHLKTVWETFITDMLLSGKEYFPIEYYCFYNGAAYYAIVDNEVVTVDTPHDDEMVSDKIYVGYKVYYAKEALAKIVMNKTHIRVAYEEFVGKKAMANDFSYKSIDHYVFKRNGDFFSLSSEGVLKMQTSANAGKLVYEMYDGSTQIYLKK